MQVDEAVTVDVGNTVVDVTVEGRDAPSVVVMSVELVISDAIGLDTDVRIAEPFVVPTIERKTVSFLGGAVTVSMLEDGVVDVEVGHEKVPLVALRYPVELGRVMVPIV